MGGNWSCSTALRPDTVDQHTRKIKQGFDKLIEDYDYNAPNDSDTLTFHVYTWIKPFHLIERPLDRHKVVDFTLDHQEFATVELQKCFIGSNYTIYPESKIISPTEEKIKCLEYVGCKQYSRENSSLATDYLARTAVNTMLEFGDYNFLFNNCQDYVDKYLGNIDLNELNNVSRRRNDEHRIRAPNYYTDLGRFLKRSYDFVWNMFIFVPSLYVFLPAKESRGVSKSYDTPTSFNYMFMVLVLLICSVSAAAILRGLVKRNVKEGYDIFSYYVSNSNGLSLLTMLMICVMYMYKSEKQLFLFWYVCFGQCVGTLSGSQITARIAPFHAINAIIFEYCNSDGSLFSWHKNPAVWILIVFPKKPPTTRPTTMQLAGDTIFSVFVTLLPILYTLTHTDNVTIWSNSGFSTVFTLYTNTIIIYPMRTMNFILSLIPVESIRSVRSWIFIAIIPSILIVFLFALPSLQGLCYYLAGTAIRFVISLATKDCYKMYMARVYDWWLYICLRKCVFGEYATQHNPWLHGIPILNDEKTFFFILLTAFTPLIDEVYVGYVLFASLCYFHGTVGAVRAFFVSLLETNDDKEFYTFIFSSLLCVYSMIKFKDPRVKIGKPLSKEAIKLILSVLLFCIIFIFCIVALDKKMKIMYFVCYICTHALGIYMKIY